MYNTSKGRCVFVGLVINSLLLRWTPIIVGFQRSNRSVSLAFQCFFYYRHGLIFFFYLSSDVFRFLGHITASTNVPKMRTASWLLLWISNHPSSSVSRQDKNNLFLINILFSAQRKSLTKQMPHGSSLGVRCLFYNAWQVCRNLKIYTGNIKILGARRVACSTFHIWGPQILCDTIQNFVARGNWGPEILHPWCVTSARLNPFYAKRIAMTDEGLLTFTIAVACLINVFNSTDNSHLGRVQICSFFKNIRST
jgi:hypothetical protein